MLAGVKNRSASWKDALAFAEPTGFSKIFFSQTPFEISEKPCGDSKWSFDSIMKPKEANKTFAQMEFDERLKYWQTTIFHQLGKFLKNEYDK